MKKGSEMFFRTGPWNGYGHNGVPDIRYNFFPNKNKLYYIFQTTENFQTSILILNRYALQRYIWDELEKKNGASLHLIQKTNVTLMVYVVLMEIVPLTSLLSVNV